MAKEYSHNDMLKMQQDAMRRVQEMQSKAQRTLQNANGSSRGGQPPSPMPREMEERIRQNDAPRPQQGQQRGPRYTKLPVEFPHPITTQTTPPQRQGQQSEPQPSQRQEQQPEPQRAPEPSAQHKERHPQKEEPQRRPYGPQQMQRFRPNGNMPMRKNHPQPSGGLAGLFGSSGDFIKKIMADKDLMMVMGLVWLLSGEEEGTDQSLILSLLYIIM